MVARTPQGYRFRGNGDLHTIRLANAPYINFSQSDLVAGFNQHNQQNYVHLTQSNSEIVLQQTITTLPYIESSNAFIKNLTRQGNDLFFDLKGYQAIQLTLANAAQCQLKQGTKILNTRKLGSRLLLEDTAHELTTLRLSCPS